MLLVNDDIQRIMNLGFKKSFFVIESRGFKKIKNKKSQAKETLRACEDTYQLAKKLRHEAKEKRSQALTEVNKYRQLILDYFASN